MNRTLKIILLHNKNRYSLSYVYNKFSCFQTRRITIFLFLLISFLHHKNKLKMHYVNEVEEKYNIKKINWTFFYRMFVLNVYLLGTFASSFSCSQFTILMNLYWKRYVWVHLANFYFVISSFFNITLEVTKRRENGFLRVGSRMFTFVS